MRIFITGASGFLGACLIGLLRAKGHELTLPGRVKCDLQKPESLNIFDSISFDYIYHLAAWTQAGDFCLKHPGEQWIINQKINTNVLDWWSSRQQQAKLVFMGTSCAYAENSSLREHEYMDGEPIESLYTYAMTKRMLYQGARALHQQYGLQYLCAVPSTLYGPGYHTDGRQMHFIFDLIRKIIRGQEYHEPVVLWGDGFQRRELVLVDDFAQALLAVAEMPGSDILNIGAGHDHSIREFAEQICQVVGYDSKRIQYDQSRYVGAKAKCLNIEKIRHAYPQFQLTSLDMGIKKTIEWFYRTQAY